MYVCGAKSGIFEFKNGILSDSAINGNVVVFENIDKAPFEVIATLIPFVKYNEFLLNGAEKKIGAEFKILATISNSSFLQNDIKSKKQKLISDLFHLIHINALTNSEIKEIGLSRYPYISRFEIFDLLFSFFCALSGSQKQKNLQNSGENFFDQISNFGSAKISLNDFFKCCKRVNKILENFSGKSLISSIKESILRNITDCFISKIPDKKLKFAIFGHFGQKLNLSSSRIDHIFNFDEKIFVDRSPKNFVMTDHCQNLLQKLARCVNMSEPVLLIGETGIGKTFSIQILAEHFGKNLKIFNFHQQTESNDLIGSFKPTNSEQKFLKIKGKFDKLLQSAKIKNQKIGENGSTELSESNFKQKFLRFFKMAQNLFKNDRISAKIWQKWLDLAKNVKNLNFSKFGFAEGILLQSLKNGDWVLLDEINLASRPVLERIESLIKSIDRKKFLLLEKGEKEQIRIHKDFRLFASCNPSDDFGKKELPESLKSRFSQIYVNNDFARNDITKIVQHFAKFENSAKNKNLTKSLVENLTSFYMNIGEKLKLTDRNGENIFFSIRTFVRALKNGKEIVDKYPLKRAIYEGFSAHFLTPLNYKYFKILDYRLKKAVFGDDLTKFDDLENNMAKFEEKTDNLLKAKNCLDKDRFVE
ncbi:AAA ATPase midasin, partial [Bonamia ostreae]